MNSGREGGSLCTLVVAAVLLASGTSVAATDAVLKGQVTGAQLQSWLDSKAAWAGVNHQSGCYYLNTWDGKGADGKGRFLQMNCPNGFAEKIAGTMRIVGNKLCATFKMPYRPNDEECLTWHVTGEAKFEQKDGELKKNSVYMLSVVPMPRK